MKYFLLSFLIMSAVVAKAQKYVLLDPRMLDPVTEVNIVTSADKFKGWFPVEKKMLPLFIRSLEEIQKKLVAGIPFVDVKDYVVGCVQFTGRAISIAGAERLDYVIVATCENLRISMHLVDAKISSAHNGFFIKMWIRYIRSFKK